jgi:hypothetical protein
MEFVNFFGYLVLARSVLLVVILAGIVLAIIRRKRHPRVSLLTVIALMFYLFESYFFSIVFHLLPGWYGVLGITPSHTKILDVILQLVDDSAFATVLALLVTAAFTGRNLPVAEKG